VNRIDVSKGQWLKAELHAHCNLDPVDYRLCPYSAEGLIQEAARLGYQVLALTCHDRDVWTEGLSDYAAGHGIILIPGMEATTREGRHILVYNFQTDAENLDTLDKIHSLSRPDTLVIAPHPYFPSPKCLGRNLEREHRIFDAVEISGFFTTGLDFNRRARTVARRYSKPLVGNSDLHQLWQLDRTFTWIQAEPEPDAIITAIKEGRTRVESRGLTYPEVMRWWVVSLGRAAWAPRRKPFHREPPFLPTSSARSRKTGIAG
jgi:predicted metal-dependent phosphoesterase TrpH